mgnify:CR=1 FL=1|jgi:uncharacterized protein (DUF302 family)
MKTIVTLLFGMLAGVILAAATGWNYAPELMLVEHESPYSVEKTVEMIKGNAINEGWVVPGVSPIHKSIKKHGGGELLPVMLVNICQPGYAYDILKEDDNKIVSVFMPCTISVYEKSDGKAYIGTMNAALLGKLFGGSVAEIMGEKVAADQRKFITLN